MWRREIGGAPKRRETMWDTYVQPNSIDITNEAN